MTIIYHAKTKWAGLVWVHAKYLNTASQTGRNLVIKYEDKTLEIPYDKIREHIKRQKTVKDKFNPSIEHNQYGFEVK